MHDAIRNTEAARDVEERAAKAPTPDLLLESLGKLTEATRELDASRKLITLFLASQYRVPHRRLAGFLGVSSATVHKWIHEDRIAGEDQQRRDQSDST
jgi:hypothetical protein